MDEIVEELTVTEIHIVDPMSLPNGVQELSEISGIINTIRSFCLDMGIRDSDEARNLVEAMKMKAKLVLLSMTAGVNELK